MMGWNNGGCLRNLVPTALMVTLVVAQQVECNGNDSFVRRSGTNFAVNGKRFYFNGFNAYWLMYMASEASTRSKVTTTFQQASFHGLKVARTWAFSDGPIYKALQTSPGSYDESVFRGLDFVVWEAGKRGVRVILSLVNNWKDYGGKNQYVEWAKKSGEYLNDEDDFFTHPLVKQYYKNHIKAVVTRINTISGIAYKDDPAIFAWELMNEPRSKHDNSGKVIQEWVTEMAAYVKSIDSNHLLEVGLEGFYGETIPQRKTINPGYQLVGTDFISTNQVPQIDFATIHIYPDQWLAGSNETDRAEFVEKWIEAHIEDSEKILGKPIVVGEFGMSSRSSGFKVEERDSFMRKIYNAIYDSASSGGPCSGGLFWQLLAQGMDSFRDGNEIIFQECPSTTTLIDQQSRKMSSIIIIA